MALKDIVNVQISTAAAKVTRAGFGIPLILSTLAAWAERTRTYATLAAVGEDFATTSPEYLMASAIFSQELSPERVVIGRLGNAPTQRFKVTVAAVADAHTYQLRVGATTVEFTSDADATNDEIVAGLVAAINAVAGLGFTASAVGDAGSQTVQLLADAAGAWLAVESPDVTYLLLEQDHTDPGVAADLAAILLENGSWYTVLNPWNSRAMALAIAAWVEANEKTFVAQTVDSPVITTAAGGATDVAAALAAADYARTAPIYSGATDDFADARWAGACLPLDPGSETWKFKTLAGLTVRPLTDTQLTNLRAKSCNFYEEIAGVAITADGVVSAGEFVDVVRFRDWLKARMAERIFGALANAQKVPYTDKGAGVIEGLIRAQLQEGVDVGGLSDDPAPEVSVPRVSSQDAADRSARIMRDITWEATLAGAIHSLRISGRVAV